MDEKPTVHHVFEAACRLSNVELRQVLEMLRDELKHRYKCADQLAAMALKDAYWVETTKAATQLPAGAKGHIVEIRRDRVAVHFLEHGMFSVSASMLRKVDAPPGGCSKPAEGH